MYTKGEFSEPFREWAKANNLQLKVDEDGLPIVPSSSRKWKDHLFDGFKNGDIGLSVCRDTPLAMTWAVTKLREKGIAPYLRGDCEALFRLSTGQMSSLSAFGFKKRKGPPNPRFKAEAL